MRSPATARAAEGSATTFDYCARPTCRNLFEVALGPGRPRRFCSDICRRSADTEMKQARARIDHLARQLRMAEHYLAAFGCDVEPEGGA